MYTGFGAQLAFAILADYAGALSANLQVRQFTPFTLFSSPMAALLISQVAGRLGQPRVRFLRPAAAFLALAAALAMILKVTNDPLLGNQWMFYTPGELQAARWTDQKVDARDIWLDTTAHPINALAFWEGTQWETSNSFDWGYPQTPPPYVLISKLTRLRGNRSGLVLPSTNGYDQVYDNGDAQLFKRQPRTPYQR